MLLNLNNGLLQTQYEKRGFPKAFFNSAILKNEYLSVLNITFFWRLRPISYLCNFAVFLGDTPQGCINTLLTF